MLFQRIKLLTTIFGGMTRSMSTTLPIGKSSQRRSKTASTLRQGAVSYSFVKTEDNKPENEHDDVDRKGHECVEKR